MPFGLILARSTYLEQAIPATCTQSDTISRHTHAADSIFMTCEDANPFTLECIPDVAVVVIIPGKKHTTRDGEGDGCDAAKDIIVGVGVEFTVRSEIKELARGIVRPGDKCIAVGEESKNNEHKHRNVSVTLMYKTHWTAFISDSWPVNVCTALPVLMSHTLAVASHAPDTKTLAFGARDMLYLNQHESPSQH